VFPILFIVSKTDIFFSSPFCDGFIENVLLNGVLLQKNVSEKASHVGKCFNQFVSLHSCIHQFF